MSEAQKGEGASLKHDVAVPVGLVPAFLRQATIAALRVAPDRGPCPSAISATAMCISTSRSQRAGTRPPSSPCANAMETPFTAWRWNWAARSRPTEHGIGVAKKDWLVRQKGEGAIAAMRAIKAALDPKGIMNPGKVL